MKLNLHILKKYQQCQMIQQHLDINQNIIQQQTMNYQGSELLNCVSPVDLIKALNTLKRLSTSPQSHTPLKSANKSFQGLDFKQYLNKKKQQPNDKAKNQLNYKAWTPKIKQCINMNSRSVQNLQNVKSRSHSPVSKIDNKPTQRKNVKKIVANNYMKPKVKKTQNVSLRQKQNFQVSFHSKKILQQLSKTGRQYKPIQQRTNELIKQKQLKITQKKRDNQFKKQLSEKQCTFKPKINKKKPKTWENPSKISERQQNLYTQKSISRDQHIIHNDDSLDNNNIEMSFSQQPTKRVEKQIVNIQPPTRQKYKNKKFNFLLDLIH